MNPAVKAADRVGWRRQGVVGMVLVLVWTPPAPTGG